MDLFFDALNMQCINRYIKNLYLSSRVPDSAFEHIKILTGFGANTRLFLISIHSSDSDKFQNILNKFLSAIQHIKAHGQKQFISDEFMYINLDSVAPFEPLETKLLDIAPSSQEVLDVSQMDSNDASSYLGDIITEFYESKSENDEPSSIYQALRYAFVRRVTTTIEGRLTK